MKRISRLTVAVGLVTVAATALAACTSSSSSPGTGGNSSSNTSSPNSTVGYNSAANNIINVSSKTGGTLQLLSGGDCDSWDPQRTYYGWCWNMQRLFTRTLVGYSKVNGDKFTITGDLATNTGVHNSNYSQWTYTLKKGLKFSTGKAITPLDIKYGIERLFATSVIYGGPSSYFLDVLSPKKGKYTGPYKDGSLSTITTTSNTITFHLNQPYSDFPYLMALPAAAPVPYKVEGGPGFVGSTYGKHPVSSGPFEIKSYIPNKSIDFVRNPYWKQSTDTIRHPKVDAVDLNIDTNPADIDQKLQAGEADARADNTVQAAFQSKILTQASLKANADDPVTAFTRYVSVMQTVIPNIHCREAIFYAFDKADFLRAYGGATAGVLAGGMTPPGIQGYQPNFNPYPSGASGTGDVAKAKQELKLCGQPNGFSTKFAYSTPSPQAANAFQFEQAALAKVGIKITAVTAAQAPYYTSFIGSPANIKNQGIGIAIAGWGADFPTPYGFYNSITNGKNILPTGNTNYTSLNDPTVNSILAKAPSGTQTTADYENLDKAVLSTATYLPIFWGRNLYYRNPQMTNVTCNNAQAFGIYDFVNIGLK